MKYVILVVLIIAVYSTTQCYPLLTAGEPDGFLRSVYCRISFFHFIPRKFSPVDFVIHLFIWVVIGIVAWRVYAKYIKARFY
jgi:hypothetical protein